MCIIFNLLINAVILLLNCLVLILYLYIHFVSLRYFISRSLYCFTNSISHGVKNYFPGCGVWASLMLFFSWQFCTDETW